MVKDKFLDGGARVSGFPDLGNVPGFDQVQIEDRGSILLILAVCHGGRDSLRICTLKS